MKIFAKKLEHFLEMGGVKKDIICLVISGTALLFDLFRFDFLPFPAGWIAIVLCGIPIILEAVIGLITAFDIKADVLVSLALIASIWINEIFAAGEIAFIMQLGALLEELTVKKARDGIEKLICLAPKTARKTTDKGEKIIPADQVKVGDILRVLPGESIPVDGIILEGQTSINQAVMTGESLPVDKTEGDEVLSGTVNQFGVFTMKAVKVGKDSSVQRMVRLVQSADAGRAKIVRVADRFATWIVASALIMAGFTWFFSGEIIRAVTILVVFCPCALVLATPTAIMAAIGNVAKRGFLVREGGALERLSAIDKVVFDKTGTLTYGMLKVVRVESLAEEYSEEKVYYYAACAELFSEHPLGRAVVRCYKKKFPDRDLSSEQFKLLPGRGVTVVSEKKKIMAGNKKMMEENSVFVDDKTENIAEHYFQKGNTVIYISVDRKLAGYMVLSDMIRDESGRMLERLKMLGISPVLLTGDHENTAAVIAQQLQIEEIHAGCLPEDKLQWIDRYQKKKESVCMIGDGINDAPALKKANVGIAMGGVGSDIAIDAADIVLVDDEVKQLPYLFALSKRMMTTIRCNLIFSMGLNFLAVILAMAGVLSPVVGALIHNGGSVIVIINSALLLKWREK
jgi:heavy metal translocating P-type ATPase